MPLCMHIFATEMHPTQNGSTDIGMTECHIKYGSVVNTPVLNVGDSRSRSHIMKDLANPMIMALQLFQVFPL